jgi:hypothetical protein
MKGERLKNDYIKILQHKHMHGSTKNNMMTCIPFKEFLLFLQMVYSKWDLYNQSSL